MLEMSIDFGRRKWRIDKDDLIFKSSSGYILCRGLWKLAPWLLQMYQKHLTRHNRQGRPIQIARNLLDLLAKFTFNHKCEEVI